MRPLLRALAGHRDDLELQTRWWHRLAVLSALLAVAFIWLASGAYAYSQAIDWRVENIEVLEDLSSFIGRLPENRSGNVFAEFKAQPGSVGVIDRRTLRLERVRDALYEPTLTDDSGIDCAKEGTVVPGEVQFGPTENTPNVWLDIRDFAGQPPTEFAHCFAMDHGFPFTANDVVRFEFNISARLQHIGRAIALATGAAALVFLVLANIYYRGLIYVAFGSAKSAGAPTPQADVGRAGRSRRRFWLQTIRPEAATMRAAMADRPRRKPGRPPLDPSEPSVNLCLRLPNKGYEALSHDARQARMTLSDYVREVLAHRRVDRRREQA